VPWLTFWAGLTYLRAIQAAAAVNRVSAQSVELGELSVLTGPSPGPVICTTPYTVNLLTDRPALPLPAPDPADAVVRIAHQRYPVEVNGYSGPPSAGLPVGAGRRL
jgi:hypothetical protein